MCRGTHLRITSIYFARLRDKLPGISFATDRHFCFPGETDEDLDMTMRLLGADQAGQGHITRYSRRPQTPAADLYDMPDRIKKDRSRSSPSSGWTLPRKNNCRYLGLALQVVVTERGRGKSMKARTRNYTGVVIKGMPPLGSHRLLESTVLVRII